MEWFRELDVGVLRLINQTMSNSLFDYLMPFASGNKIFFPIVLAAGVILLWKGGVRGRICVAMLLLLVPTADGFLANTIKHAIARPRPFVVYEGVNQPMQKLKAVNTPEAWVVRPESVRTDDSPRPGYNSMPSAHATNWFAATMILLVYYRRSWIYMLPPACVVAFSRVYNGVHFPSDVLAGAILGAGWAAAGLWLIEQLWNRAGRRWFPEWHRRVPSFVNPGLASRAPMPEPVASGAQSIIDQQWLRTGYVLIAALFIGRLVYIGSGAIQLSEDEAYQWTWSKHLALSYFSKPPMIAYTQFLGTTIWGDTEFGVRFFAPVLAAVMSLLMMRFLATLVGGRGAFLFLMAISTTPLLAVGSTLMTVDPLQVFFWTLAMISGWKAVQPGSSTRDWVWTGLWMGLGFLSKYTALFQWLCWAVFFVLWKPARIQLRRPGPYIALVINAVCTLPVLIWNSRNDWITVSHVADNASLQDDWKPAFGTIAMQVLNFVGQEFALFNPVFFIAIIWASIAMWRHRRNDQLLVFFFSMGAPLFLCYFLWSFRSEIKANWIAPSVLPLIGVMVLYWKDRWLTPGHWSRIAVTSGWILGIVIIALAHEPELVKAVAGRPLPPKADPSTRVRSWSDSAALVERARKNLEIEGAAPAFIICDHYGITGQFTFYSAAARARVRAEPLVYAISTDTPHNQYFFWEQYRDTRKGQNAIFVRELSKPKLVRDWVVRWLRGEPYGSLLRSRAESRRPPQRLVQEFESVRDLGQFPVTYKGRVFHVYQIFECRNLQ